MSDEQSNPSQSDNPTCRCGHVEGSHRSGIRNCTWPGCDCQTFSGGTPSAEKAKGVAGWTQAQCAPYGGIEILPVAKEPPLNPSLESLARDTARDIYVAFRHAEECEEAWVVERVKSALEKATSAARDIAYRWQCAAIERQQAGDTAREEVERLKGELSRAVEFAAKCERGELRHDENLRKQFEKILKLGLVKRLDEDLSDCIARELARLTRIAGDWNEDNLPPSPEEWRSVTEEKDSNRVAAQESLGLCERLQSDIDAIKQDRDGKEKELAELREQLAETETKRADLDDLQAQLFVRTIELAAQLSEAAAKYGTLTTEFVAVREERDKFWNSLLEHKHLCRRKLDEITRQRDELRAENMEQNRRLTKSIMELAAQCATLREALVKVQHSTHCSGGDGDCSYCIAAETAIKDALALTPAAALREHALALAERAFKDCSRVVLGRDVDGAAIHALWLRSDTLHSLTVKPAAR